MFGLYFINEDIFMHINEVKELLHIYDAAALKKYGQNFLIDEAVLQKISASQKDKSRGVIEIGPGLGSLTRYLVQDYEQVLAYEIDPKMVKVINDTLPNVQIIQGDFLKQSITSDIKQHFKETPCVISNLPYYITTPIILKITEDLPDIKYMTFMMQKEVAERIMASPNSKEYGSLSIFLQVYFQISKVIDVSPHAFYPQPDVSSTVLAFERRTEPLYYIKNHNQFKEILRLLFQQRRKTLYNNLKVRFNKETIDEVLNQLTLNPNVRSEDLPIKTIVDICNLLS